MNAKIIDACCLINLYSGAMGTPAAILKTLGTLYVPAESRIEAQRIRKPDPEAESGVVSKPLDIHEAVFLGLIQECRVEGSGEENLFVELTERLSDGEAACIAIARSRNWVVATDDRKASRISKELGVPTVTTPELVKTWVDNANPPVSEIVKILKNIEDYARYRLPTEHPLRSWWDGFLRSKP